VNPGEGAELWGLTFQDVLKPLAGVVVTAVAPGSVAALAGIQVGWMVEAVGDVALGDPKWPHSGGVGRALALFDQWLQTQVDAYLNDVRSQAKTSNLTTSTEDGARSNETKPPFVPPLHVHFRTASPSEAVATFQASGATATAPADGKATPLSSHSPSSGAIRLASALSVHVDASHKTIVLRHVPGPKLQAIKYVARDFSETQVRQLVCLGYRAGIPE